MKVFQGAGTDEPGRRQMQSDLLRQLNPNHSLLQRDVLGGGA